MGFWPLHSLQRHTIDVDTLTYTYCGIQAIHRPPEGVLLLSGLVPLVACLLATIWRPTWRVITVNQPIGPSSVTLTLTSMFNFLYVLERNPLHLVKWGLSPPRAVRGSVLCGAGVSTPSHTAVRAGLQAGLPPARLIACPLACPLPTRSSRVVGTVEARESDWGEWAQ